MIARARLLRVGARGASLARLPSIAALLVVGAPSLVAAEEPFYSPVGELVPGSGSGRKDDKVYAPGIRYPLEKGPSYPNSQVWGVGGSNGPAGSQCDAKNYSYPWHDNYCETRSWDMPLCPAGTGHQGQDIRAPTCEKGIHNVVAVAPAVVTNIPDNPDDYATYLNRADGTRFDYLHGEQTVVKLQQQVATGDLIEKVSNHFGGTATSIHCHFNIKQDVGGFGFVYVPPYTSLIEAYKELMGLGSKPPQGAFDQASCDTLDGWAQDPDKPDEAITAVVYFDGLPTDPDNLGVEIAADLHRDDLCQPLGSCEHGFSMTMPRSLRDTLEYSVHVFAEDGQGPGVEVEASPRSFTCPPPPLPKGVRRWIPSPEVLAAWRLSPFWDLAKPGDAAVAALPVGPDLGEQPLLVRADDGAPEVWLIDQDARRWIPSPEIAARWGFDLDAVETWPATTLETMFQGPHVRAEPFMIKGSGPWIYLIDDPICDPAKDADDPLCSPSSGTTSDTDGTSSSSGGSSGGETGGVSSGGLSAGGSSSGSDGDSAGSATAALPNGYGEDDAGCGCRSSSPGSGLVVGFVGVVFGLRRRRRR
ncbi:MAG: peptidoglycan DD-metalloendopeptidase family protein [Nannocystaceae bacterium]